jgi:hypothetical protein
MSGDQPERRSTVAAHFALHFDDGAVGVDGIEIDVRMWIDEVEARQCALDLEASPGIEAADAVVSDGRCARRDDEDGQGH